MAKYKRNDSIKFVNPYTFVSINRNSCERGDAEQLYSEQDVLHTGYLECRLITKTPLAIPDAEKKEEVKKDHFFYPFYSIDGEHPLIPGSSIRGAIRNVYEAVTDSCLPTLQDNTGLSKRNDSKNAFCAGILIKENNEWNLYPADKYLIPCKGYSPLKKELMENEKRDTEKRQFEVVCSNDERVIRGRNEIYHNGTRVSFDYIMKKDGEMVTHKNKNDILVWKGIVRDMKRDKNGSAYVCIGEKIYNKHGEEIFVKTSSKPIRTVKDKEIDIFLKQLEESIMIYRNKSINREYKKYKKSHFGHFGYSGYETAKKNGAIPLWYDKSTMQLSLAAIGRIYYRNSLNDLLGKKSAHCKNRNQACKACSLFGMIGEKSLGSRVRVTDAELISDIKREEVIKKVTLRELGMPRYSYLPFYAKTKDGNVPKSYDDFGVEIRGRKFYWHNIRVNSDDATYIYSGNEQGNRNATMELLGTDNTFSFKIYYDSITAQQLDELIWCVTFGENKKDGEYCYKIGHGKPLGLGSVKIVIDKKVERNAENYTLNSDPMNEKGQINNPFNESTAIKELLKVSMLNAIQGDIQYPYIDAMAIKSGALPPNDVANHKWFTENKGNRNSLPAQKLPYIINKEGELLNQELSAYSLIEISESMGGNKSGQGKYPQHNNRNYKPTKK